MRQQTLVGNKIGNLTILKKIRKSKGTSSDTHYLCLCDCGKTVIRRYCNLQYKHTKSCGCFKKKMLRETKRKDPKAVILRAAWNYYKRNAKNRHIDWQLTYEQFESLVLDKCEYCDSKKSNIGKTGYGATFSYNGIDRVNNEKGYTAFNTVPCCKICNRAKGDLTKVEYIKWLKRIGAQYGNLVHK